MSIPYCQLPKLLINCSTEIPISWQWRRTHIIQTFLGCDLERECDLGEAKLHPHTSVHSVDILFTPGSPLTRSHCINLQHLREEVLSRRLQVPHTTLTQECLLKCRICGSVGKPEVVTGGDVTGGPRPVPPIYLRSWHRQAYLSFLK